jgi:thiaminase/transcriptional activator TenA
MSTFTDSLWRAAAPVYEKILAHPFLRGLTDSTLPEAAFRFYVLQDAHYLRDYGRGLALVGAKAADDDEFMMFAEHGRSALIVERALHEGFFSAWKLDRAAVAAVPVAPACHHYVSYLMRVARERPYHEALGAFLPCYWVYWEVGRALTAAGSPNALYQKWIDTYGGEEFGAQVRQVLEVVNRAGAGLTDEQREAVSRHFVTGTRLEWMFWDGAWKMETWPA